MKNWSFLSALGLLQDHRIYFLKEQRTLFFRIMELVLPSFPEVQVKDLKGMLQDCRRYESMRYRDQDLVFTDRIPLL